MEAPDSQLRSLEDQLLEPLGYLKSNAQMGRVAVDLGGW